DLVPRQLGEPAGAPAADARPGQRLARAAVAGAHRARLPGRAPADGVRASRPRRVLRVLARKQAPVRADLVAAVLRLLAVSARLVPLDAGAVPEPGGYQRGMVDRRSFGDRPGPPVPRRDRAAVAAGVAGRTPEPDSAVGGGVDPRHLVHDPIFRLC